MILLTQSVIPCRPSCNFYIPKSYQIFKVQHKYFLLHETLFYHLRRNKSSPFPLLEIDTFVPISIVFVHIFSLLD